MPPSDGAQAYETGPELWEMSFAGKTVVIGLGNPYMRDDGVGIHVAKRLRGLDPGRYFVYETQAMDMSLLWQFKDARKIVLVDAMSSGSGVGSVSKYAVRSREGPVTEMPSLHALQLFDLFDIVHQPGLIPCPLTIVGIEPKDCSPGEGLSEEIERAVPRAVEAVMAELQAAPS